MNESPATALDRQSMNVDIVCVGFGPAMGGFLTTLSKQLLKEDGTPAVESAAAPGMPPQVICYERADDLGFGVSGVVTPARSIKASFPQLDPAQIPMAAPVKHERVAYLLDPIGASRRSLALRSADALIGLAGGRCRTNTRRSTCRGCPLFSASTTASSSRWASSCNGWARR